MDDHLAGERGQGLRAIVIGEARISPVVRLLSLDARGAEHEAGGMSTSRHALVALCRRHGRTHHSAFAMSRNSATISRRARRSSIASHVNPPCLYVPFREPLGAPLPGAPPCIRQRCFPVTRHVRHGLPFRVFAPHRPCEDGESVGSGDCMGLTFDFKLIPTPSRLLLDERSHRGLSTCMDVDVLDNDLLLPTATNAGEGFHIWTAKVRRNFVAMFPFASKRWSESVWRVRSRHSIASAWLAAIWHASSASVSSRGFTPSTIARAALTVSWSSGLPAGQMTLSS